MNEKRKLLYSYRIYGSDIKKNETMKFTTEQKEMETVILSGVAQTKEDMHHRFSVTVEAGVKSSDVCFNHSTHRVCEINKMPWEWLWREGRESAQI